MFKNALISLFVLTTAPVFSQNLVFQQIIANRPFDAKLTTLSETEKKEAGVLVKNVIFIEYAFDSTGALGCYQGDLKRVRVNDAKGVETYNKIVLPVLSSNDLIYLKARTISANGVVKEIGKEAVKDIEERGRSFKILAVEGLEVGGELEYIASYRRNASLFGSEILQTELPVQSAKLFIVSPEYLQFEAKVYNAKSDSKIDTTAGIRILTVEVKDIQPVNSEKYSNTRANLVRADYKLSYNTSRGGERLYTWQEAASTFYNYLSNGQKESEKDIKAFIIKQKIKGITPDATIRNTENYIKTSIAVNEDVEPEAAAAVLKKKFGSKASIMRLYSAILTATNIPFEIVIGNSRAKLKFDKDFDCWSSLDDYLLYFPATKKYLDPVAPEYRYGLIEQSFEGNNALFIKTFKENNETKATGEVRFIPFSGTDQNHDDLAVDMTFSPTLDQIQGRVTRNMAGQMAAQVRPYYYLIKSEDDRKKITTEFMKGTLKQDATYQNVVIKNTNISTEEGTKPFIISADVVLKSVIERAGKKFLFKVGELIGPQVEMYNERPRQYEIDMGNSHSYHRLLKIKIPAGYKISGGLDGLNFKITDGQTTPDMGFVASYKLENDVLTVTIDEFYKKTQLPVEIYPVFQKVINAAADFNKVTLVLEKI